jgi:hypothetical protein
VSEQLLRSSRAGKLAAISKKEKQVSEETAYLSNPTKCTHCETPLKYQKRNNKFCSQSCAASHNNTGRISTVEANQKRAKALRGKIKASCSLCGKGTASKTEPKICQRCNRKLSKQVKLTTQNSRKKLVVPTISGPFSKIYYCICKFSGTKFISNRCIQVHPNLARTLKEYKYSCRFLFGLQSYPVWFKYASELINQHGWYKPTNKGNNLSGCSRDHLYSITDGWKNNVPPEIIRHPANCEIVPHKTNQSKGLKSSITLSELYQRIEDFEKFHAED